MRASIPDDALTLDTGDVMLNNDVGATDKYLMSQGANTLPAWTVPVLTTALTTGGGTTDNVTVSGMTSAGHCTLTPTNATAAGDIASTYISNKTTNQITVTHPASAGRTWDILCVRY